MRTLFLGLVVGFTALGCGGEPAATCDDPVACTCGADRALPDGSCCPVWTRADAGGVCRERTWTIPPSGQTLGEPGARRQAVSLDGTGRAFLVWDQADEVGQDLVIVAEEGEGGFSLRTPSAALPGFAVQPSIVAGETGFVVVSWRQSLTGGDGDIHRSERSEDGTWTDPTSAADRVSFGEKAYEPRLATRPSGEVVQVWNQWYDGMHFGVAVARRSTPGGSWEGPTSEGDVLSPPSFFSNAPQIALNTRGDALSSWYQSAGTQLMAFMSERLGPDGAFSRPGIEDYISYPGAPVDSDPVSNPKPALAEDGRGVVVWTQETGQGDVAVYMASRSADGVWTRPTSLADTFSRPTGACRDVRAVFDRRGTVYVVWSQIVEGVRVIHLAMRATDGTWVHPGDAPLVLSSPFASEAISPVIAAGRDGGVAIAWSEEAQGNYRVVARRGDAAGFGEVEGLSPPDGEDALSPHIAIGGPNDRAAVVWAHGPPTAARVMVATVE